MTEKHEHRRDNEPEEIEHSREADFLMPNSVKLLAGFINRVGFPIFAFCVLAYFYWVGLQKNTQALQELRDVMLAVKVVLDQR